MKESERESEKTERRRKKNSNRDVYVQKEGGITRDNAKRETQKERERQGLHIKKKERKKRATGGCSLSPRIVHRFFCFFFFVFWFFFLFAAFFYLSPVPHSPFSELHAPNPTSDPHKGRRGRNTFGKSPSNRLQRTWSVSQISFTHDTFIFSLYSQEARREKKRRTSHFYLAEHRVIGCSTFFNPCQNHSGNVLERFERARRLSFCSRGNKSRALTECLIVSEFIRTPCDLIAFLLEKLTRT